MGKRVCNILPGIPGALYVGMNVATGVKHAVRARADGWHPACETNRLPRPVKGRIKALSEYRPLTPEEAEAWTTAGKPDPCSNCYLELSHDASVFDPEDAIWPADKPIPAGMVLSATFRKSDG